jgi:hypothetical protein
MVVVVLRTVVEDGGGGVKMVVLRMVVSRTGGLEQSGRLRVPSRCGKSFESGVCWQGMVFGRRLQALRRR